MDDIDDEREEHDEEWPVMDAVAACLHVIARDLETGVAEMFDPTCEAVCSLAADHPQYPGDEQRFRLWLDYFGELNKAAIDVEVAKVRPWQEAAITVQTSVGSLTIEPFGGMVLEGTKIGRLTYVAGAPSVAAVSAGYTSTFSYVGLDGDAQGYLLAQAEASATLRKRIRATPKEPT